MREKRRERKKTTPLRREETRVVWSGRHQLEESIVALEATI
jgi:hypothetical protein